MNTLIERYPTLYEAMRALVLEVPRYSTRSSGSFDPEIMTDKMQAVGFMRTRCDLVDAYLEDLKLRGYYDMELLIHPTVVIKALGDNGSEYLCEAVFEHGYDELQDVYEKAYDDIQTERGEAYDEEY